VDEGSLTVTISMLRRKLGDTPSKPRYIETVRKSGYRFVGPVTRHTRGADGQVVADPSGSEPHHRIPLRWYRHRIRALVTFVAVAAVAAVMTGWYRSHSEAIRDSTHAPLPVHPFGGIQDDPSFSPDGSQIAFTWRPPESANDDIYVLKIGDLHAIRLTTDPASEKSPAWSPDGRRIAFIRRRGSNGDILLISPAGGPEQKVIETAGTSVTWSSDSQTLAYIDRAPGEDAHSIFLAGARVPKTGTVTANSWTVIDKGILWIDVTASNPPATIRFHDLATHEVSNISQVTSSVIPSATGFSAVRDGSVLMWSQLDRSAADLMLAETSR
jgi:hypothetical protein